MCHRCYQMELLKVAIFLQALSLCQGLQNTIPPSQKNVSQSEPWLHEPATNQTDAFIPQLSGNCSGTLGLFNHTEWSAVLLTSALAKRVASQICRHLGCMKAISVSQTALHNTTCLICAYSDFKLMNCTEASQDSCSNVTEIVCKSSWSKAIRLVGGSNRCEGRVELWNAGKWGTVCHDNWDLEDANIVCKQLSCGSAFRVNGEGGVFGVGSGPIFLDKVNCTGTENNLWDCSAQRTSNCTHEEDAVVICSDLPGAQQTTTVAATTGSWTTTFMTSGAPSSHARLSPAEVGCVVLSLLLAMALAANAILCWRFRKRQRGVCAAAEPSKLNLRTSAEQQENDYRSADNAHKLPAGTTENDVNPRVLCAQHSVGNFSIDSDYEPYDFSLEPAVALATFKNSLRNRSENRSPKLKPSSLYCLTEEGTDQASGLDGKLGENHVSGISETKKQAIPTVDTFDSSSTSSGECYENTRKEDEQHTQGDALPVEMAKGGEAFQPQTEKYDPELEDSFDSSSTSSGESYENTGKEAERHIQEMTGKDPPIQPQNKHYDPSLTNCCFQPDPNFQEDSFDSSSTSSGECYENTREPEQHTQGDLIPIETAEREGPIQPQTEDHGPALSSCYLQPSTHDDGDSSSTSSGDDYDIPEGQDKPLCPAGREDSDQSSSDSDYDDIANYML